MASDNPCGMPTRTGEPCGWHWEKCPLASHRTQRRRQGLPVPATLPLREDQPRPQPRPAGQLQLLPAVPQEPATDTRHDDDRPPLQSPPAEERDVRGTLWWVLRQLFAEGVNPSQASAANSLLRTLAGLGDEPLSETEAMHAVELRARIMLGLPPTPGDWQALETMVDADTLAELRRWPATPA